MPDLVAPSSINMILSIKDVDRSSLELSANMGEVANSSQSSRDSDSNCSSDSTSKSSSDSYSGIDDENSTDSDCAIDDCPVTPDDCTGTPVEEIMPIPALVTPPREEIAAHNEKCSDATIICSAQDTTKIVKDSVIMTSRVEEAVDGLSVCL